MNKMLIKELFIILIIAHSVNYKTLVIVYTIIFNIGHKCLLGGSIAQAGTA